VKPAVLLYSGGADSTLCAILLAESGYSVHALSIVYDGRPAAELAASRALAVELGFASHREIRIEGLATGTPGWVESRGAHHEGLIPFRNLIFWSLAANRAAEAGARAIAAGHTRWDADSYDDAGPAFFATLEASLAFSGLGRLPDRIEVILPLAALTPPQMADAFERHRAILHRTWSCWRDGAEPCGDCFACRGRTFDAPPR
jgi:7-cyano-7-deazaguanine synthase